MSVLDDNKAIVDECIQALFSRGEFDKVERYLPPDFVNHDPSPGYPCNREGSARSPPTSATRSPTGTASYTS